MIDEASLIARIDKLQAAVDAANEAISRLESAIRRSSAPLLTFKDIIEMTGMCRETIWLKSTTGKMPKPLKLGHRTVRFRRADIEEWIAEGCPSTRSLNERAKRSAREPQKSR